MVFSLRRRQEAVYWFAFIVPWYMTIGHRLSGAAPDNACTFHLHQVNDMSVIVPAIFPQGFLEWKNAAATPKPLLVSIRKRNRV